MKKAELKLCGLPAVLARWQRAPDSIHRLFFDRETGRRVGAISKALAATRRVYRCVEDAELEKVAGTLHHGGIVAVVDGPELREPSEGDIASWARRPEPVLVLDRVGNAHNLGALVRTAAFLQVPHLLLCDHPDAARPNEAAYRVAEGGFEALAVWQTPDLPGVLAAMKSAGFDVVGAATRGGARLSPGGECGGRPAPRARALVLGNEERGLSREVESVCSRRVTLAGSESVESLNVSVAGALLMWELLAPRPRADAPNPRSRAARS
ncbi:23S rRNA (guanosine-2'-O-)-methyltransferase RlmB [mine drainage metagenome]|uniref:23S rRNA (Guanosine-2'-O-)-methyltransferase RlmB n=1 Tax=mine drainage metagenome TaxID=410659 RepID=A0A1J5T4D9_9ZZZZ